MFTVLIFFYALDGHFLCSDSVVYNGTLRESISLALKRANSLHKGTHKQIFITDQSINTQVYYTSNFA